MEEEAGTIRKGSSGKAGGGFGYAVTKMNDHFWWTRSVIFGQPLKKNKLLSFHQTDCWSLNHNSDFNTATVTWVQHFPLFFSFQAVVQKPATAFKESLDASSSLLAHFSNSPEKLCSRPEPNMVRWHAALFLVLCCCWLVLFINSMLDWLNMHNSPTLWHKIKPVFLI